MKRTFNFFFLTLALTVSIPGLGQVSSANGIFNNTNATAPLLLQTNGTTRVTIINTGSNAGSVGIGTSDPKSYKLAVAGKIVAEEMVVKLQVNWSDYVFDSNYKLMPLGDVETYILRNKHLPDVPSAADVSRDGVPVGEMNAILLKKIEELTLYLIELKKENEAIKKLIDEKK